jgi:hypothetical protein
VAFGTNNSAAYIIDDSSHIHATVPSSTGGIPGQVHVVVTTGGGSSTSGPNDLYTYVGTPTVTAVSPNNGPTAGGTPVTITGTNFLGYSSIGGVTSVKFGAVSATFSITDAGHIAATSPPGAAGLVDVRVTSDGGTSTVNPGDQYTYNAPPPPPPNSGYAVGGTGPDNALKVFTNASGFANKGGQLLAAPAIVGVPRTGQQAEALYLGTGLDNNIWVRSDAQDWQQLAPNGTDCLDNPAATVIGAPGSATLYVACQGSDHSLWWASGPVTAGTLPTVGNWAPLGGILSAGPALASVGGVLTFLVTGTDNRVWSRTLSTGYQEFGAICIGHPALATAAGGTSYFACRGTNGALWYATKSGASWGPVVTAGGAMIDGPGIAALSTPYFFVEGVDGSIWRWTSGDGWVPQGGSVVGGVGACVL